MYRVCGIVYHADDAAGKHFVCRFIDKSGGVYFHDGAKYKDQVVYYDNIVNFPPKKLQTVDKYVMKMVIYTRL
ncbi:hypothetical protein OH76DRAFT_1359799 [Lentinus brumalis]|uniref:USP domain-containing protein n=2 Tax=Polyporaceae TaxID=5317 RepID=A0A371CVK2_9APHY|nr:hypothetical protein OH76DRAFT_1366789 [Polyporus brumalis]RDX44313.1 hypothetical protein OH76DRAFT_1359799 [Polyporus brumalis]